MRRSLACRAAAILTLCSLYSPASAAELALSSLFGDGMVLQRDIECPVWGKAVPNAEVEARIGGKTVATTVADGKGTFRLKLPKLAAPGPYEIELRTKDGTYTTTLRDVLAGEVWLCSGQSNMQWRVADSKDAASEIASANHPNIRLYHVPRQSTATPLEQPDARWQPCTPKTIGDFSAVAYSFGRALNAKLDVPIGLIHSSYGGTPAESWTPIETLRTLTDLPVLSRTLERAARESSPEARASFLAETRRWLEATGNADPGIAEASKRWASPDFDDSGWRSVPVPANLVNQGVANGSITWLRRRIDVPADVAARAATLELGNVDDFDQTFVNGNLVGGKGIDQLPIVSPARVYSIPAGTLRAGENVIAVRVHDLDGRAGLLGNAQAMRLIADADSGQEPRIVALSGDWKLAVERDGPTKVEADPTTRPLQRPSGLLLSDSPQYPGGLYNAMIAPLHDYAIRGAIWYQGESNANRAAEYETLMTKMIGAWREQFGVGDFPFYIVGLANFRAATTLPAQVSEWGAIRAAQRAVAEKVENVRTTVTIDIGEANNIHPRDKQTVGQRLANVALEETYNQEGMPRSPTLKSVTRGPNEHELTLTFDRVGTGLVGKGEALASFSLANDAGIFAWADARIEGTDRVIVSSPQVERPTVVRYAYADNPSATLYSQEGQPAEPFEAHVSPSPK